VPATERDDDRERSLLRVVARIEVCEQILRRQTSMLLSEGFIIEQFTAGISMWIR